MIVVIFNGIRDLTNTLMIHRRKHILDNNERQPIHLQNSPKGY